MERPQVGFGLQTPLRTQTGRALWVCGSCSRPRPQAQKEPAVTILKFLIIAEQRAYIFIFP